MKATVIKKNTKQIFQFTMVSQNDPECSCGNELLGEVTAFEGGILRSDSFPLKKNVSLPIPPPPNTPIPPPPPTWFLELDGNIEDAYFTVTISGPDSKSPTTITIDGSKMKKWIEQNEKEKTNQIYKESSCGIFGFAQKNIVNSTTSWIYTITAGVSYPVIHPSK